MEAPTRSSSVALLGLLACSLALLAGCGRDEPSRDSTPPAPAPNAQPAASPGSAELRAAAKGVFASLPARMESPTAPASDALIALGRQLYFEKRLSKNQDLSCNSCHQLDRYGVDVRTPAGGTSSGHRGQLGGRNSPTVYHAALHLAQFWDGRAADVEAQAKGPILNPVEMAMPGEAAVVAILKSIPGYAPLFAAAFPGEADPLTYDNLARAIGAFERRLVTPAPFDRFLEGDDAALDADAREGLSLFLQAGCTSCHYGPAVGGQTYQKLGLIRPYPTQDQGRFELTRNEVDRQVFKVPSLRNIEKTGPYFHDGSIPALEEAVKTMAAHQTAKGELSALELTRLVAFLRSLTGELPAAYIEEPPPLAAGLETPGPDPS